MRIIDCPWELKNLNCRVVEISVDTNEELEVDTLLSLESRYDYIVMKIGYGRVDHYEKVSQLGYYLIETQMTLLKNYVDWHIENDPLTTKILQQLSVEPITTNEDFDELMDLISENMFTTDRIYLDPHFGPGYSMQRYKNWTRTEWQRGALLYKHYFRGIYVGFSLCKLVGNELSVLLAGCFEKYQKSGIGFWLPLIPLIYKNVPHKVYTTHISTNNFPVWQMYNRHQYLVTNFDYVFVKHIQH